MNPNPFEYNAQIIASLSSGVIAVDQYNCLLTANEAAAHHLNIDPAQLQPGQKLAAIDGAQPLLAILEEMQTTHQAIRRRELTVSPGEGKKTLGVTASLLRGEKAYNGAALLFTDLTRVRQLESEAQLNRQLAQVGELTAGVVHELRNPLSVISGMAELLMRKLHEEQALYRNAEIIHKETRHLEQLVRDFLGFARPQELRKTRCDPREIIRRSLALCRELAEKQGVRLTEEPQEDLELFDGDAASLARALSNLVRNAIEASPSGKEVRILARQSSQGVHLRVEDEGPGIAPELRESLLNPFVSGKEDGTGLGLSIVHRIITAHHGSLAYGPGKTTGAFFEVVIPCSSQDTQD